jgi:hypothetical protein
VERGLVCLVLENAVPDLLFADFIPTVAGSLKCMMLAVELEHAHFVCVDRRREIAVDQEIRTAPHPFAICTPRQKNEHHGTRKGYHCAHKLVR